jgi:hypothetical protein
LVDLRLREGNVHSAEGALQFVLSVMERVEKKLCQVTSVRLDAGFPEEKLLAGLEAWRTPYVARVRNNAVLNRMAEPYLVRPVGRPPKEPRTWATSAHARRRASGPEGYRRGTNRQTPLGR